MSSIESDFMRLYRASMIRDDDMKKEAEMPPFLNIEDTIVNGGLQDGLLYVSFSDSNDKKLHMSMHSLLKFPLRQQDKKMILEALQLFPESVRRTPMKELTNVSIPIEKSNYTTYEYDRHGKSARQNYKIEVDYGQYSVLNYARNRNSDIMYYLFRFSDELSCPDKDSERKTIDQKMEKLIKKYVEIYNKAGKYIFDEQQYIVLRKDIQFDLYDERRYYFYIFENGDMYYDGERLSYDDKYLTTDGQKFLETLPQFLIGSIKSYSARNYDIEEEDKTDKKNRERREQEKIEEIQAERRKKGLCQHCGGRLIKLYMFSPKQCEFCSIKKDY